jgi:hypothetical protein
VRNTVYFDGNAVAGAMWVLAAWAVGGVLVAVGSSALRGRRRGRSAAAVT